MLCGTWKTNSPDPPFPSGRGFPCLRSQYANLGKISSVEQDCRDHGLEMATVWDAAKALLALAGTEDTATTAARELAVTSECAGDHEEAAFWRGVVDAIAWESNPQPLIAPDLTSDRLRSGELRWPRDRRLELPKHRSTVLRFQRDLRELWQRYHSQIDETDRSKDEPK